MKISKILSLIPLVGSILLIPACTDEIPLDRIASSDTIQFKCVDSGDWSNAISRSADSRDAACRVANAKPSLTPAGVFLMDGSSPTENPFYLHSFDYDDIVAHPDADSSDKSRASGSEISNEKPFPNFGVTAFHTETEDANPGLYMFNNIVEKNMAGGLWGFRDDERYWPASGKMRFIGCYPSGSSNGGITLYVENNTVKVEHNTPDSCYKQVDLCVAIAEADCKKRPDYVPMTFYHAFTRVKFVASQNMLEGRINYIKIKNIHTDGTLTFPDNFTFKDYPGVNGQTFSRPDNLWTLGTEIGEVYRTAEYLDPALYDEEKGYVDLTVKYEHMFMLLPQTLPDDAVIEISFTDKLSNPDLFKPGSNTTDSIYRTKEHILTAKIGGTEWLQGCTKIYKISYSSIEVIPSLEVPDDFEFSYRGGTASFPVTSKATVSVFGNPNSETVDVPWKVEYLNSNGDVLSQSWISGFDMGVENYSSATDSITAAMPSLPGEYVDLRPHTDWIRGQESTFGNVEDLSLREKAGYVNTANCYVINHAGDYKLPLVYGNAIKNSVDNVGAYTYPGTKANDNVLTRFINHVGQPIQSPYIKNASNYATDDVRTPKTAKLMWQDAPDLIASCSIDADKDFLLFSTADTTSIREGNAVIAVIDNKDEVMWSWHIWITDYIPRLTVDVNDNAYDPRQINSPDRLIKSLYINSAEGVSRHEQEDTIMGVPLGWCSDYIRKFLERGITIRVTQVIKGQIAGHTVGLSKTVNVKQTEALVYLDGNAPYYQFGRKDPFCPALGSRYRDEKNDLKDKQLYDINNKSLSLKTTPNGTNSLDYAIKNPDTFITVVTGEGIVAADWCSTSYFNLWSSNVAEKSDILSNDIFNDIKTIYDPSPAGYEVPDIYAFTFVTPNGGSRSYLDFYKALNSPFHGTKVDLPNSKYTTDDTPRQHFLDNLGYVFYCMTMPGVESWNKNYGSVYFAAIGARRRGEGTLQYGNDRGYYWTSTPQFIKFELDKNHKNLYDPENYASSFGFHAEGIMPTVQNGRANGQNVRPIREKNF